MPRPPLALLITGPPGSGKCTVAAGLARALRAALLDLDPATEALTRVVAAHLGVADLDDPRLSQVTRTARYATLEALARESLGVGTDGVVVAPFTRERRDPVAWDALRERLDAAGATTVLVWLRVEAPELRRRVANRGAQRDLAKQDLDWISRVDLGPPSVPHLEVDAARPPEEIVATVLAQLP